MKRIATLLAIAGVTIAASVGLLAGTAHAKSACTLLTKQEASAALGFKVVKTEKLSEPSTKTQGCDYISKKQFEDVSSPLKLRITVQPLNADTKAAIDQIEADSDSEPVEGLGDRAFYTSGNELIASSGNKVFQTDITNVRWSGDELDTYIKEPELAAMKTLIENAG